MSDEQEREQTELVQLTAVAVASRESFRYGQAGFEDWVGSSADEGPTMQGMEVLDEIAAERMRQDAKWGNQAHGRAMWAMILAEEIGEWADELRVEIGEDGIEPYEATQIRAALEYLRTAGEIARRFLEAHAWPEGSTNKEVFDAEVQDREATPAEAARDAVSGAGGSREEADDAAVAVEAGASEVVSGTE